ncbi:HNH endonuclease [Leptolyngbya ectocarpi]
MRNHRRLKQSIKESRIIAKSTIDSLYTSWRNSSRGKEWKANFLEQCGFHCPECNQFLTDQNCTIDHKLPRSKYPWLSWNEANLWLLCRSCNIKKSDQDWAIYIEAVKISRGQAAYERVTKYKPL